MQKRPEPIREARCLWGMGWNEEDCHRRFFPQVWSQARATDAILGSRGRSRLQLLGEPEAGTIHLPNHARKPKGCCWKTHKQTPITSWPNTGPRSSLSQRHPRAGVHCCPRWHEVLAPAHPLSGDNGQHSEEAAGTHTKSSPCAKNIKLIPVLAYTESSKDSVDNGLS